MKITSVRKNTDVKAGSFIDLAKEFLRGINKGWDILKSWGLEVEQSQKEAANNVWSIKLGNDKVMQCKVSPVDKDGKRVDLVFKDPESGKTREYKDKPRNADKWYDMATEAAEEFYGSATVEEFFNKESGEYIGDNDEKESASSSTRCKIRLKKVMCSDGFEVQMCGIDCPNSAMLSSVGSVLNNKEFVKQLGEDESCFSLEQDGDTISVDGCKEFEVDKQCIIDSITSLMAQATSMMITLRYWKWNCTGTKKADLRDAISEILWALEDEIEKYADWMIQYNGSVPNVYSNLMDCCGASSVDVTYQESILHCLKEMMTSYVENMNLLYCNFPHNLQVEIDHFINICKSLEVRRLD